MQSCLYTFLVVSPSSYIGNEYQAVLEDKMLASDLCYMHGHFETLKRIVCNAPLHCKN